MKITDVKVIRANKFLFVKISTDENIHGVGESGAWGFLDASAETIESFKTYLIGKDPLDTEQHWQYMYRCFHFRGAAVMAGISAIDIALWDIAGKYFNVPLYKLIGGQCRNKLRTYYHVSGSSAEELVESCVQAKKDGYTAIGHLSPFLDEPRSKPYFSTYSSMIDDAAGLVGTIREAVGPEMDLCLEMHRRLKPGEAIAFSRAVEKYRPMFLEDPIVPDNFDSMALVAERSHVPIATGERIHTIQEYDMLFSRNAMTYARVSPCVCGGITGTKKIAALAEAKGIMIVPHSPLSPVSGAACMHIATSTANFSILELPDFSGVSAAERYTSANKVDRSSFSQRDLVDWVPEAVNGYVTHNDRAGLGIDLQDNIDELYPYSRRGIVTRQNIDGSVVDQ